MNIAKWIRIEHGSPTPIYQQVIGGIENKVFNLVLFTVALIVLAFSLVIFAQLCITPDVK